jgi:hypothetical protein
MLFDSRTYTSWLISDARFFTGVPTTGKSSALAKLNSEVGFTLGVDSDVVLRQLSVACGYDSETALWEAFDIKRTAPPELTESVRLLVRSLKVASCSLLRIWHDNGGVVFTNFDPSILLPVGVMPDFAVTVEPVLASARATERAERMADGDETVMNRYAFSEERTSKWDRTMRDSCTRNDVPLIQLQASEFLGDVMHWVYPDADLASAKSSLSDLLERDRFWRDVVALQDEEDKRITTVIANLEPPTIRRLLVRMDNLFVKLSWRGHLLKGWEVYESRPPLEYWLDNYGHEEPPLYEAESSFMLSNVPCAGIHGYLLFHKDDETRTTTGAMIEEVGSPGVDPHPDITSKLLSLATRYEPFDRHAARDDNTINPGEG